MALVLAQGCLGIMAKYVLGIRLVQTLHGSHALTRIPGQRDYSSAKPVPLTRARLLIGESGVAQVRSADRWVRLSPPGRNVAPAHRGYSPISPLPTWLNARPGRRVRINFESPKFLYVRNLGALTLSSP